MRKLIPPKHQTIILRAINTLEVFFLSPTNSVYSLQLPLTKHLLYYPKFHWLLLSFSILHKTKFGTLWSVIRSNRLVVSSWYLRYCWVCPQFLHIWLRCWHAMNVQSAFSSFMTLIIICHQNTLAQYLWSFYWTIFQVIQGMCLYLRQYREEQQHRVHHNC